MKTYTLKSQTHDAETLVLIGSDILSKLTEYVTDEFSAVMIVTDSHVAPLYLDRVEDIITEFFPRERIFRSIFEAGENQKALSTVTKIYEDMARSGLDRKSVVINLGGGVVSDMGGFAAATYMRGIPFINVPTTLESMVDASVGGKTGVNLGSMKNYIGTFSQPKAVIMDIKTLSTLPHRVLIQGYAEVIKHGLIYDAEYFSTCTKKHPQEYSQSELVDIIYDSVRIKSEIVKIDPKEQTVRKTLNFGHTIGHAIESLSLKSDSPLFHGEAVAIGMVAEAYISFRIGDIKAVTFHSIEQAISHVGLPIRFHQSATSDDIEKIIITDKKNAKGTIHWSLLKDIGEGDFNVVVGQTFIKQAIEYILS